MVGGNNSDINQKLTIIKAGIPQSTACAACGPVANNLPSFPGSRFSDPHQCVKNGLSAHHFESIVSAEKPLKAAPWAASRLPAGAAKRRYQAQEARRREGSATASSPQSWPTEGIGGPWARFSALGRGKGLAHRKNASWGRWSHPGDHPGAVLPLLVAKGGNVVR